MGDDFYRSKDPTNSIKVLKEKVVKEKTIKNKENTNYTCITHTKYLPRQTPAKKSLYLI